MTQPLQWHYRQALEARGETFVKETHKYIVMTRKEGGHYYIGRKGSLRFGDMVAGSIPCSAKFKKMLVGE